MHIHLVLKEVKVPNVVAVMCRSDLCVCYPYISIVDSVTVYYTILGKCMCTKWRKYTETRAFV